MNWFIAWNNEKIPNSNRPTGFEGFYWTVNGAVGYKPLLGGFNVGGGYTRSFDKSWSMMSLGVSTAFGPTMGLIDGGSVEARVGYGTTKQLLNPNNVRPTDERSFWDISFNWASHLYDWFK